MARVVSGCYQHSEGAAAPPPAPAAVATVGGGGCRTEWRRKGRPLRRGAACRVSIGEDLGSHRKELPVRFLAYWLPSLVTPALPCGGLVATVRLATRTESGGISGMGSGGDNEGKPVVGADKRCSEFGEQVSRIPTTMGRSGPQVYLQSDSRLPRGQASRSSERWLLPLPPTAPPLLPRLESDDGVQNSLAPGRSGTSLVQSNFSSAGGYYPRAGPRHPSRTLVGHAGQSQPCFLGRL